MMMVMVVVMVLMTLWPMHVDHHADHLRYNKALNPMPPDSWD